MFGARRVAGDEDRLGDLSVDVLEDGEQERSAARVPDEDGSLLKSWLASTVGRNASIGSLLRPG